MARQAAPVVFIGLDACDPALAQQFAAAGEMPTLARMLAGGTRAPVRNPFGLFVGSVWPTLATGLRADRHEFHCWDEIDIATYERRLTQPPRIRPFWKSVSDAGRKIAVLDVPHVRADQPIDGLHVAEWGNHDRHFGFHTWPPAAAAEIESTYGLHPILGIRAREVGQFAADDYVHRAALYRTADEDDVFLKGLLRGLDAKRALVSDQLARGGWDLFFTVFGESHAIGHQQWHLHDPTHPRFEAARAAALGGDPVRQVYRALDGALADALAKVPKDATTLVLLSHGMAAHYDGTHLLDAVLTRLDGFDRAPPPMNNAVALGKRALAKLPAAVQRRLVAVAAPWLRARVAAHPPVPCNEYATAAQRARQDFFLAPNNYSCGGVRLNVVGREPHGCVEPRDVDAVCRRLEKELLALVNVTTGGRVVRRVSRSDRLYRRSPRDTLPDLFVEWENTALIETVWSAKSGTVYGPYAHWRTGDHRPDGLLIALGPGMPRGVAQAALEAEDLAPSIAARLGVALDDIDGKVAPWLGGR
ncbi:MAG: alkaline phosphatase family protein [Alphaproteobacteria bacterium]